MSGWRIAGMKISVMIDGILLYISVDSSQF